MRVKQVKTTMENSKENSSEDYIRSLNPSGGFFTPPNYLESNVTRMKDLILKEQLNIPETRGGFEVPENYFENFKVDIRPKQSQLTLLHKSKWISIAASLLLIGFTGWIIIKNNPNGKGKEQSDLQKLSTEEIINHLDPQDINAELLCDAGWCNELQELENESKEVNPILDEVSEEDLTELING